MSRRRRHEASSGRCSSPGASSWRACRRTPASSASSACTTSSRRATRARSTAPTGRRARCSACQIVDAVDALPDGAARPRLRVHAGGGQPRPAARLRRQGHPGRVHRVGRLRRGRRRGPADAGRAGGAGRRARACCVAGPNGQGVVSTPVAALRPDRGALPAGGPDRHRQPVGQLHLLLHELRRARPGSA